MVQKKTSTSKSPKSGTGKKVTQSSGRSKKTTQSSSRTVGSLKKNLSTLTTSKKKQSTNTSSTTKRTSSKSTTNNVKVTRTTTGSTRKKNRGVKHTRCRTKALFPHRSMPWRLEPKNNKFNLSWFMCFDHAVDHIERIHLKPTDYKLMCHTSVPVDDPLTGDVRTQRYVV